MWNNKIGNRKIIWRGSSPTLQIGRSSSPTLQWLYKSGMQMWVPRRSKNFCWLKFWLDTTCKPSCQAQWSGLLNYFLLARSEITCHLIITCQKSLHSVVQHNIFELALTSDDEDSSHSFGEIKLQTIQIYLKASKCKGWNRYLDETDLRKYQLSIESATAVPVDCGTAPRMKVAALCNLCPRNRFNFWPGLSESHN
jgi:hypothetical protein